MAVVHYQIELYDLSMIRALARDLARTAESHPISAEDPYEHERRARARIASAARALHEIASHAVLVPEDKIVQNRGRVAGTAKKGRAGGAGRPVILIEYGIQPVEGGWHPIVWERGRARYHWTKKVFVPVAAVLREEGGHGARREVPRRLGRPGADVPRRREGSASEVASGMHRTTSMVLEPRKR